MGDLEKETAVEDPMKGTLRDVEAEQWRLAMGSIDLLCTGCEGGQ
jgi:hypothetical protein